MKKLFGTDGIRGIAITEIPCSLAYKIGAETALLLNKKGVSSPTVLIGCDSRASSPILAASIISGLCAYGADAQYLGTVSTPCASYLTLKHGASAAIMISASHNPAEYNGIKIFDSNGIKLPDELEEEIENMLPSLPPPTDLFRLGKPSHTPGAIDEYVSYIKSTFSGTLKGLKLAIDCANGSASVSASRIFSELGAEITMLSDSPDGYNINQNCGSTNVETLRRTVLEHGLDAGIAFDGDADRCIMVDEKGNTVDGDTIMAICALDMKERGKLRKNTIVATVMSNFGLTKFCEERNIALILTSVGDRYVSERMREQGYLLGGEQSGHIIFGEHSVTGDGQLTALKVLEIICKKKIPLSSAASVMKVYPQSLVNIKADDTQKALFGSDTEIAEKIRALSSSLSGNGRILVRPSGTEPLIRIMAEASDTDTVKRITSELAEFISKKIGG